MTDNPQAARSLRAVLTVTVETRPDGGHYFDQADFTAHATEWVRAALKGQHAVDEVTVVDQAAELARAQAEAHQYRTALQGAARAAVVPSAPADRAAILREAADAVRDQDLGPRGGMSRDYENGWWNSRAAAEDRVRRMVDEAQQPETQAAGWHLTPQALDLFVRALVSEVDYDIHKGYECGEEDGEDHYPELIDQAAEMLDAITAASQPGKEARS